MASQSTDPRSVIHAKIIELARDLGHRRTFTPQRSGNPRYGFLDSPGLLELIMFYEQTFGLEIDQEDLTLDNFGTIDSMGAYLEKHGKSATVMSCPGRRQAVRVFHF